FKGLPFSDGVLVGETLYVGGHVGIDPKTGKAGITAEEDEKFAMDGVKQTLDAAGMTMDDLVSVQVYCTSVSDYATFNGVYKTYFTATTQPGRLCKSPSLWEIRGLKCSGLL